jgi:hypothetical protein
MRLTLEMTNELTNIDGVMCRIWTGHSDTGVPVRVYVHRVAIPLKGTQHPFNIELVEMEPPTEEESRFD